MENTLTKIEFNPEQINLIKDMVAKGASDNELKLFLYQCQRTGLDPLTRQIYCLFRSIKNKDTQQYERKMSIQTSIDGFRVIAERTGTYGGQDEPVFIEGENLPICAKVTVYRFRGDQRYQAAVGVAYWAEYVPQANQDAMWRKMPHNMLAKVAEALALRKAFPQDLSGLYTSEEMAQSGQNEFVDVTSMPVEDNDSIEILIDSCETIPELSRLYNQNKNLFESNAVLKEKLSHRKNILRNEPTTAG